MDENIINPRLLQYLASIGVKLPDTSPIDVLDAKDRGDICLFCFRSTKEAHGPYVLQYTDRGVADSVATTPYQCCKLCFKIGVQRLEKARVTFTMGQQLAFKNGAFMTTLLETYIDSRGQILPKGFQTYREGGENDTLCVFCDNIHHGYAVDVYSPDGRPSNTGTYMCETDYLTVKDYEQDWGKDGLFDRNFPVALTEKMKKFLRCVFDSEIKEYYQHFLSTPDRADVDSGTYVEHCIFCTRYVSGNYTLLDVPVFSDSLMSGGMVRCCNDKCYPMYYNIMQQEDLPDLTEVATCATCRIPYTITKREARVRELHGDEEIHACPACVFKNAVLGENTFFSTHKYDRFKETQCSYCESVFYIDLLIARKFLSRMYPIKGDKIACDCCNKRGNTPIFTTIEDGRVLRFYTSEEKGTEITIGEKEQRPAELITGDFSIEEAYILALRHLQGR